MKDPAVEQASQAALEVLHHNARGAYGDLPRTAGWGYPEPYTRDLMISALGVLTAGDARLIDGLRRVLVALAENQSARGQIPGLAHDPTDLGSSDTTPLFLIGLALYRKAVGEPAFLAPAAARALDWMAYQSPDDSLLVAQQPTADWRDEQWVLGYGLYVNTLVYTYLRLYGRDDQAAVLRERLHRPYLRTHDERGHVPEGLAIPGRPYYALWSWKVLHDERCDLLGNSLAILSGLASAQRAGQIVDWIEGGAAELRACGDLAGGLPPCLFPYIQPDDPDWRPRYSRYNLPGEYHNGGLWPFVGGFYVSALVAGGRLELAREKLHALTALVRPCRDGERVPRHAPHRPGALAFGFNEWLRAQDGSARGQDWQSWSAAMYLYAAACVEQGRTPFLDALRPCE